MRAQLLLATALLTGCATSDRSGHHSGLVVKSGIFRTGEFAHLQTSDGAVFELRVLDARDREWLYALAPITSETTEPQCIDLRAAGRVNGETQLERAIFVVSKVTQAKVIGCGNDVR